MPEEIPKLLQQKILVLDGAMGTSLQKRNLSAEDFGGEETNGCNEYLVVTRPDVIRDVHEDYLKAGADIVETNTFGGTPVVLDEFGLGSRADELNRKAVELAKEACQKYSTEDKPRFVAGSIGPTTKALSVTGGISFDELAENFRHQAYSLTDAGADYLLLETALDTLNLKAAWVGLQKAFSELQKEIPVAISITIETMGSMLAGQGVEALYASVEHMNPLYIGLNCATGPEFMRDHVRSLSAIAMCPVSVVPNAGLPDEDGNYLETPESMVTVLQSFIDSGWINVLGGCCGTTPEHIAAMAELASGQTPRSMQTEHLPLISGIDPLLLEDDGRPYIVGERTNVIGSRAFKTMISEEKYEEAAEIARKQVKAGAHIIDVCVSNPDRDEVHDMKKFLGYVTKLVKVPLMIDSQVPEVVEEAFKLTQGKCILNSVNLEDGEKSFEELLPIVKKYGASVVVGCIEGEMAVTAQEKLQVAKNSHKLLTEKYGIPEEDIIFDPLVFPCGTGDEKYFGSGAETIEGVRLIHETFPRCQSTLGISNVSFGLPAAGREVLNAVFVYHCTKAGLSTAIVNSEKLARFASISEEEKKLCDDLLWYRTENGNDPVANFAAFYRDKKVKAKETIDFSKLSIEEKLNINIVEGTKERLIENLDEALKKWDALGVINNPLMAAMGIVGKMFNENELIVAEVLQSAEVMKTSVNYLEQFMEKEESNVRGTVVLATVKGDVHDIGKNLVEIILGNNGFKIINLGIKCPSDVIMKACQEKQPDMVGLSGLLVKSAQQMVITAKDFEQAGIKVPILVGGAALSEQFTVSKIGKEYSGLTVYCKDAMTGLSVANSLTDKEQFDSWLEAHRTREQKVIEQSQNKTVVKSQKEKLIIEHSGISRNVPDYQEHILEKSPDEIWPYLNLNMLYGKNLGLKGSAKRLLEAGDPKALKLQTMIEENKQRIREFSIFKPQALYRFFKARSERDSIIIYNEDEQELKRFTFPRQEASEDLCLSDFVHSDRMDSVALFVATCGCEVGQIARELLDEGKYVDSHTFFALAMETAESLAEVTHKHIRELWGIGDDPSLSIPNILQAKYTGIRVSFGYPACPNLEDQGILWDLLKPDEKLGVKLTEDFMMEPEASVSALVFHHPQAKYFSV